MGRTAGSWESYDIFPPLVLFDFCPTDALKALQRPVTAMVIWNGFVLRHGIVWIVLFLFLVHQAFLCCLLSQRGIREDKTNPNPGIFPSLLFPRLKACPVGHRVPPLPPGASAPA